MGYDPDTGAVALRAAPNGSKGRYTLRAQSNGGSLVDGRRFLAHHGLKVEKARSFPAEAFGDGMVGFRFGEGAGDAPDTEDEDQAPAKVDAPATSRRPVRVSKRSAAAATA